MNTKEIIDELRKLGIKVDARKRTDGGWIIKQIDNMTFTGSKGNAAARKILGVELSQARIEQATYNVNKYIKGNKESTLDEATKKELRKVQRTWRKNKVGGKAKITAKKVKRHIKEHGRAETKEYLRKMSRYGEGYAYEENIEYLAQYTEDIARVYEDRGSSMADEFYQLADYIRSIADHFKEDWIGRVYQCLYTVRDLGYEDSTGEAAISTIYSIIS